MTHIVVGIRDPTRLHWVFLFHSRLWKKPRLSLKEIYAVILTPSHEHKLVVGMYSPLGLYPLLIILIGGHFADVYHRIIDAYLLIDREAETSVKYFALQLYHRVPNQSGAKWYMFKLAYMQISFLFTVPSVAIHIVRQHNLVSRLLAIITAFFTNQIEGKHIV
jgi:E3 ubiquitin-protein ligase UBR1